MTHSFFARLGGVQFPPALALPAPLVRSTVGPHDPALTTRGTAQATQPSPAARWSRAARTLVQKGRVRSTCLVVTRSKLNGLTGSLYGALLCAVVTFSDLELRLACCVTKRKNSLSVKISEKNKISGSSKTQLGILYLCGFRQRNLRSRE